MRAVSSEIIVDRSLLIKKINEAMKLSRKRSFKQSVELIVTLEGLDLKKPENRMTLTIVLPHRPKERKICVFADGPFADEAKRQGADLVMNKSEIEALAGDRRKMKKLANTYDFFLAQPQLMGTIGKVLGPVLGPRGKIPAIVPNVSQLKDKMESLRKSVRINLRYNPEACCVIGIETMSGEELAENALAIISEISSRIRGKARIGKVYVKTTMGKTVRVV